MKRLQDIVFEAKQGKAVVFTFGRFQPPTIGHEKLILKVKEVARKHNAEHRIYPSRSHDPKKNPLSTRDKVSLMRKLFKGANIVDDKDAKTAFHVLKQLSDNGYKKVILVVGGDRVKEFDASVRRYINHPDKKKSFEFDEFMVVSAGERDPDASDVSGMSASKMRALVVDNDFDQFIKGVPGQDKRIAKKMFDSLKKGMNIKEDINTDWDELCLLEGVGNDVTLIAVTKSEGKTLSPTLARVEKIAKKLKVPFYPVHTDHAFIADEDFNDGILTLHNYDGSGKKIDVSVKNTVCLVRGGSLVNQSGVGLVRTLEESGCFMVNSIDSMEFCHNKFSTSLAFNLHGLPSPRTALISNENSIDIAHELVGGKFPTIIKTITGAEGIGVSRVESPESLKSVLQSLWKFDAQLLMQEYREIAYDVRTLVLDGNIVASVQRMKSQKGEFRTNHALGNEVRPYKLNEEEKKLVLKAAKLSGAYYCGVDHIKSGGEYLLLEVNGSPGSGAEPYRGYFDEREGDDVSSNDMIDYVIKYITNKENWKYPTTEIGVIENITVDGIKYKAKVDTGNGTHNAIHATDVEENKGSVSFKMNGKSYKKPVAGKVVVNVGTGVKEERYLVDFEVKFGTKSYKSIMFSLSDRGDNLYPVLIGKEFLELTRHSVNVAKTFSLFENQLNAHFHREMA